jgi:acetylornithine deacetylase/succinyl-diaminopimelate desuccinylase-like protein
MTQGAWIGLSMLLFAVPSPAAEVPEAALARDILREVVEIDTTLKTGSSKAAQAMAARLRAAGFQERDLIVDGPTPAHLNVIARLRARSSAQKPVLFIAHLDVVEARRADWSVDPFTLLEKDGFFYGRGTSDMKSEVADAVANFVRLKKEGFVPSRDLILALTDDEEGGDFNGVDWLLTQHREWIDAEYAINLESGGGAIIKGRKTILKIQTADKAYLTFELEVRNKGGHSSLPTRENAIYRLSRGLVKLSDDRFPVKLNQTTRAYLDHLAVTEPARANDLKAVAAEPTDLAAAERLAGASPHLNAMMRTTCVATELAGGHAENALPQSAKATVNCRLVPGDEPAQVEGHLKAVLDDPEIAIKRLTQDSFSTLTPLSPALEKVVSDLGQRMWPGVVVTPSMSAGASDSRYLRRAGIPTFGVCGLFEDSDDVRAHGKDERIGTHELDEAVEFLYRFLKAVPALDSRH